LARNWGDSIEISARSNFGVGKTRILMLQSSLDCLTTVHLFQYRRHTDRRTTRHSVGM